jgi:Asp-tRNA(Asn)/Glu-tRNA(Gln) amidotransferase A subunit family amidase
MDGLHDEGEYTPREVPRLNKPDPAPRDGAATSAADAARAIQAGRLTSEALVAACLERIAARDGGLAAWVHVAADAALAQARALDRQPARGPLHGVPVGIKDIVDTADMPTEYGSPIYRGHRPRADAAAVALLRQAGCVILGKTATAEFANQHPPATRNPRNPAHTPGGSSSGSAAAVADGMVPLALGTQTGGSMIRPAAFCGVVGLKPSFGSINRTGVKPVADSLDTLGLFANTVEDAALALSVLSGRRAPDFSARTAAPRIGFARTSRWKEADAATRGALESAASRLAAAGADVKEAALPAAAEALFDAQRLIMDFEAARALAWEQAQHREQISATLRKRLEGGWAVSREQYDDARQTAHDARRQFSDLMRGFDLLLTPSARGEAPHGLASTGDALFNRIWTLLGVPCVTLPWGSGPDGLPLGIQLVSAIEQDTALLAHAQWAASELG